MKIRQFKETLFSENGMKLVNLLFILSLFIRNSGIIFVAYFAWIVYLAFGIRTTKVKSVKIINSIFILFATIMIIANVLLLLKYR